MLKFVILVLSALCFAQSMAELPEDLRASLRSISDAVCGDSLDATAMNLVRDCEAQVSFMFKTSYKTCVRKVHGLETMDKPFICYSTAVEGKEKVKDCLEERRKMGQRLGMDVDGMKIRILTAYSNCMQPVLQS